VPHWIRKTKVLNVAGLTHSFLPAVRSHLRVRNQNHATPDL
jgi:hypothetical protein